MAWREELTIDAIRCESPAMLCDPSDGHDRTAVKQLDVLAFDSNKAYSVSAVWQATDRSIGLWFCSHHFNCNEG